MNLFNWEKYDMIKGLKPPGYNLNSYVFCIENIIFFKTNLQKVPVLQICTCKVYPLQPWTNHLLARGELAIHMKWPCFHHCFLVPHIWPQNYQSLHQSVQVCLVLQGFQRGFQEWKHLHIPELQKHPQHWQQLPKIESCVKSSDWSNSSV